MEKVRYLFNVWLSIALCASTLFVSCGGEKDPDSDPEPEPEPEQVSPYFISFKYNETDYELRGETVCVFSRYGDRHYRIQGNDAEKQTEITIVISRELEEGSVFDIYNSLPPFESASISIYFIDKTLFDECFVYSDKVDKIGKLSITEKQENVLSGAFECKMMEGDITDGKFSVLEIDYSQD
jgi:hypothetical protein